MTTVLITGGTGLIGKALTKELLAKGYEVIVLTRSAEVGQKQPGLSYAQWDLHKQTVDEKAIQKADFIIHLAGANVAGGRWTEKRKKEILESRTKSSGLIVKALSEIQNNVKAVISASGIGFYGADPTIPNPKPFTETDPADNSFLGKTCVEWESSIDTVVSLGKRLVKLRTGIVLSNDGGAYAEFKKPMSFGVASILGSGKQIISWIHIKDIVGLYIFGMENERIHGVYNAAALQPVSNQKLIETMAREKKIAVPVKVPTFALKLALGEMSIEILKSATVSSKKMEDAGYQFMFPSIEAAVGNLK